MNNNKELGKIRKGLGVAFSTWLGHIPEDIKNKVSWKTWRDFYNDGMSPQDALVKLR